MNVVVVNLHGSCFVFTEVLIAISFIDTLTLPKKRGKVGVLMTFTVGFGAANAMNHIAYAEIRKMTLFLLINLLSLRLTADNAY